MLAWLRRVLQPIDGTATPAECNPSIVVCEFRGVIRDGSSGNRQFDFIEQVVDRATSSGKYRALALDLSDVRYTWGDRAFSLMQNLPKNWGLAAIIVSTGSEQFGLMADHFGGWIVRRNRTHALKELAAKLRAG